jgi:hypothetical protein
MASDPLPPADLGGDPTPPTTQPAADPASTGPVLRARPAHAVPPEPPRRATPARTRDPAAVTADGGAPAGPDFGRAGELPPTQDADPPPPPITGDGDAPAIPAGRGRPRALPRATFEEGTGGLDDAPPADARRTFTPGSGRGRGRGRPGASLRGRPGIPGRAPARPRATFARAAPATAAAAAPQWGSWDLRDDYEDDDPGAAFFTGPQAPAMDLTGGDPESDREQTGPPAAAQAAAAHPSPVQAAPARLATLALQYHARAPGRALGSSKACMRPNRPALGTSPPPLPKTFMRSQKTPSSWYSTTVA